LHGGIMTAMLLSSFLMRYTQGGSVNFEMGYRETLYTTLTHLVQGPLVAMGTYFLRPYQVLKALDPAAAVVSLIIFAAIALYLNHFMATGRLDPGTLIGIVRARRISELDEQTRWLLQLAAAGFVMLLLAYPLTFTTRITAISGRATRGHLAGVSGASLLFACFAYMVQGILSFYRHGRMATVILSGLFALLTGFGIMVQQDYVAAWKVQKQFWAELLPLIPDAGNDFGSARRNGRCPSDRRKYLESVPRAEPSLSNPFGDIICSAGFSTVARLAEQDSHSKRFIPY
jgi:hypothetical protein